MVVVLCTSSYDAYGNTYMKFYEHILNGFKVVSCRADMILSQKLPLTKRRNSKSINTRVMVLALCMLSNVG